MLTPVWRLKGFSGSEYGQLELRSGRLIFRPNDSGSPGFDVPVSEITDIRFPWHYFNGGFKMRIGGEEFRFSFVEPHNEMADVKGGRDVGKAWKQALLGK